MKNNVIALFLLLPLLFLNGCSRSEARNEDFTLTLHGKGVYENGGQLDCYATLHYTGDEESVTVYGSDTPVVFAIKNSDGDSIGGLQHTVLAPYVFAANETKKYPFVKTGGYNEHTPQWVKDYLTNDALTLPKGTYTITALFTYTYDTHPGANNFIKLEATKTIKVS